ncbi:MAG: diacylglycerol kinase [Planctomycetota bacterium]
MPPPPRTWLGKFADAFRGLFLSVRTQSSFAAHLPVAAAAVALGAWLGLSAVEWGLVALAIGLVIMAEVFNTSIEALAKAVGSYPDDGIRDALDHASGGVLVAVLTAVSIGLIVLGPKLWAALT